MGVAIAYTGLLIVAISLAILLRVSFVPHAPGITEKKVAIIALCFALGFFVFIAGLVMDNTATRRAQAEKAAAEETTFDEKTAEHIAGENP